MNDCACRKCKSINTLICQTTNNEIIQVICKSCKFNDIRNQKMFDKTEKLVEEKRR